MEVEKARIEATLNALKQEGEAEAALAAAHVLEAAADEENHAVDITEQGVSSVIPAVAHKSTCTLTLPTAAWKLMGTESLIQDDWSVMMTLSIYSRVEHQSPPPQVYVSLSF